MASVGVFTQLTHHPGPPAPPAPLALLVGRWRWAVGRGVIADKLTRRFAEVVALDLPDAGLRADWRGYVGPRFLHASAHALHADDQFDVVVAAEVWNTSPTPTRGWPRWPGWAIRRHLVLSVPHEPIFAAATGRRPLPPPRPGQHSWASNHWTRRGFVRFVSQVAQVEQ